MVNRERDASRQQVPLCPATFGAAFSTGLFEPAAHIVGNRVKAALCSGFLSAQPALDVLLIREFVLASVTTIDINRAFTFFAAIRAVRAGFLGIHVCWSWKL